MRGRADANPWIRATGDFQTNLLIWMKQCSRQAQSSTFRPSPRLSRRASTREQISLLTKRTWSPSATRSIGPWEELTARDRWQIAHVEPPHHSGRDCVKPPVQGCRTVTSGLRREPTRCRMAVQKFMVHLTDQSATAGNNFLRLMRPHEIRRRRAPDFVRATKLAVLLPEGLQAGTFVRGKFGPTSSVDFGAGHLVSKRL